MEKLKFIINEYSKWLLGGLVLLCLFLFILLLITFLSTDNNEELSYEEFIEEVSVENPDYSENEESELSEIDNEEQIVSSQFVDVKGAVNHPGVYEMDNETRVIDAIEKAGGFNENADSNSVNLAQMLTDQMVIYVAEEGEYTYPIETDDQEITSSESTININTADVEELKILNGVGDAKAGNIINYREENGNFKNIEDIKEVSGIGEKIYEGIKENIVVQ